jgi:hypothetical protein
MDTVYFDSAMGEPQRRQLLYEGQVFVFPSSPRSLALRDFALEKLVDVFDPYDPAYAQHYLSVEEWVQRFAQVKPAFMHHPRTRELLRALVVELGCDPADTFLDVPRLRGVTADGYLTSGVGYAHHPHRDTWYAAPMAQINWWFSLTPFGRESALAFHPRYWDRALRNGSSEFNYYEWNSGGRRDAARHVSSDTRRQPRAEEPVELEPELRVVTEPGSIVAFSAAQLHSTVPNTADGTRFSIDFRTVSMSDLVHRRGAPNIDSTPEGTSLRDFARVSDLTAVPNDIIDRYDSGARTDGVLVFRP